MTTRIDAIATEPQYASHLLPVMAALGPLAGTVHTTAPRKLDVPVLVASASDYARARRARAPAIACMEHGCGQSYGGDRRTARHSAYAGGRGREHCSLILAPNDHAAARWRDAYPETPVHVIGATRGLAPPVPTSPLLIIAFHWSGSIPEQRNAFGHYRHALPELARLVPLAGHAHPRSLGARQLFQKAGIPFLPTLGEVAARATVYAVDNSSTLWELGRTRPTIALDAPWYRRDVEHGLRFWSHAGVRVDGPDMLMEVAARLVRDGEDDEARRRREALVADVIPSLDGARRAARLLAAWTSSPEGV